jgi:hypothetical protein
MEKKIMKAFGLSRWIALGVLVLTMGAFSHPANGQTQTVQSANQSVVASGRELLIASADSASVANVAASAPLAAPTSSAPVPPPPINFLQLDWLLCRGERRAWFV